MSCMDTDATSLKIVAGMPMFNEEETIGSVIVSTLRHVDMVLCIDDGSSDSSASIAEACGAQVIQHRSNRGYGATMKTLFRHALELDADILVILDSDGQHNPNDIPSVIEPIISGQADFTIGSRFVDGGGGVDMPAYRKLGNKFSSRALPISSTGLVLSACGIEALDSSLNTRGICLSRE